MHSGDPTTRVRNQLDSGKDLFRAAALSDGVFSVAATLLIVTIQIPEIPPERLSAELPHAIVGLLPNFLVYAVTFLLTGSYWRAHHRLFTYLARYTGQLLTLNLVFLLFVAFIPLPTTVAFRYGAQPVAIYFYCATIITTGLFLVLMWLYAAWQKLLDPRLTARLVHYAILRSLVPPFTALVIIALVALGLAANAEFGWFAILPLSRLLGYFYRNERVDPGINDPD